MQGAQLLKGDLIYLDALERSDMEIMGPWWRNLDLAQYLSQDAIVPATMEDEMEWFEAQRKDKSSFVFAVRRNDDNALLGSTSLFQINWRIRKCLFGIALGDPTVWGRGYGTDATRVTLRYAFEELNLNRVQLHVYEFNERGARAYEKAGFRQEGRLRQAVYREGRYFDELVMAALRSDWERRE
jgi:RimJ/RimL family protein N-acetyltransferase